MAQANDTDSDNAVLESRSRERSIDKRNFLEWRRRGIGQLRRRRMAVRGQLPGVPRKLRDPRNDLRRAGPGSAHVAGALMTD